MSSDSRQPLHGRTALFKDEAVCEGLAQAPRRGRPPGDPARWTMLSSLALRL